MDKHSHHWNQVDRQAHVYLMNTQHADWLGIDLAPVNLCTKLFINRFSDHLSGNRTIEFASFPCPDREYQSQFGELICETAEFFVLQRSPGFGLFPDAVCLVECSRGGQHSQSLGDQVIATIAVSDFLDIAGASQLVNILDQ